MTQTNKFDLHFVFDQDSAFYTLLYDCTSVFIGNDDEGLVDTKAVLVRATKLTAKTERVWNYGDNRPKWLLDFMDNSVDEINSRIKDALDKKVQNYAGIY
ncbi:hypothetical protein UFOVP401_48 [uncultured Caudovirales phage]|uniref:Uncharacterized protein n=1 Tax=uncultured Caudovirales phage TaxID=2100421 RepID=A0A6J5M202_9CAUD|nr:hypothetical protein UFOVP401_48 [uncultured Caudovirales phage]